MVHQIWLLICYKGILNLRDLSQYLSIGGVGELVSVLFYIY